MALVESDHGHHHENTSLLIGIIIHKIPIALILVTMLLAQKLTKPIVISSLVIFSIAAPLGLFLATHVGHQLVDNLNLVIALAVGIFLHISTTILFETNESHRFDLKKFIVLMLGFIVAVLSL